MMNTTALHREGLFFVPQELILDAATAGFWNDVSSLTRINVISTCKAAEHGWIGASLSCIDILIALHMRMSDTIDAVVLSKGHAAAGQYAVLHNVGDSIKEEQLRNYKRGRTGDLEAVSFFRNNIPNPTR